MQLKCNPIFQNICYFFCVSEYPNLTMILSAFIFVPFTPTPAHGFAIGITVAGFLEILWLQFFLSKQNVKLKPYYKIGKILKDNEIKILFKRIAPGVVGSGIYQINMVVDTILVSMVGTGAISWLYYANRLQQLPLGVVGAAISVALLPILSKALKAEDTLQAKKTQDKAVEYGLLLSMPAAVLLIVLAEPIVRLLFQHGKFLGADATQTANAVMAYAIGLPCYVMTKALMPNFFARGDTLTPVKYSAVVFATNFGFNVLLMQWLGHVGIALATTIAAFVSLGQYLHGLKKRGYWQFEPKLLKTCAKIIFISLLTGAIVGLLQYWLSQIFVIQGKLMLLFALGGLGIFALAIFLGLAKICGVINFAEIIGMLRRKNG